MARARPESDPRPDARGRPPAPQRRNFALGVASGTIGTVSYDFIHPDLILAGLIYTLTRPVYGDGWAIFLVSLITVINKGGALLPQLYISTRLEHYPRKRPAYLVLTFVRLAGAAVLLVAMWLLVERVDPLRLGLFYAALLLISFCFGAGHIISMDMIGRMIDIGRVGSFLGGRDFLGGALSLVAGLAVVQPILGRGEVPQSGAQVASNYLLLAVLGTLMTAASMSLFLACREGPGAGAKRRTTLGESLLRGWRWLRRNRDYRAYFWLRVAFRVNYLALTFFIPYGEQKLRTADTVAGVALLGGVMVATFKLSRVLSSALWGWMADRYGDRACLVGTGVAFTAGPALALVAPHVPPGFRLPLPWAGLVLDLPLAVYLGALGAVGAGFQGSIIGGNRFLIGRAPPWRRLSYIGFLNTVTSPLTLLPALGAVVAGQLGVTTLFAVVVGGGVFYLIWALRIRPHAGRGGGRPRESRPLAASSPEG